MNNEGKVVVKIMVDQYGKVTNAIPGVAGTTVQDKRLWEAAKEAAYKLITFSSLVCVLFGGVYFVAAIFIPNAYNVEPAIRETATKLMQITAVIMPVEAICHATYFTLRSGGKMAITFVFDCGFMWLVNVLLTAILCKFTALPFLLIFLIIQLITVPKAIMGVTMVHSGFWVRNIIAKENGDVV